MSNRTLGCAVLLANLFWILTPASASANIFDKVFQASKKSKADKAVSDVSRKFKFTVHVTTGDVLKAIEYVGGAYGRKGIFRFISNFESDIAIKLPFLKYVDMDMIGEEALAQEYASSNADRIYLKNKDYVTGKIEGFTAKDIIVATTYGDLKIDITQVRYIMLRNSTVGASGRETPSFLQAPSKMEATPEER